MADNLDFLSGGGVATTEPLLPIEPDFKLPFFFLSESINKTYHKTQKIRTAEKFAVIILKSE